MLSYDTIREKLWARCREDNMNELRTASLVSYAAILVYDDLEERLVRLEQHLEEHENKKSGSAH